MAKVYLGLGSNIDPERNLRLAIRHLRERFGDLELSPVYKNAPVGFEGSDFLNLVVGLDTDARPEDIDTYIERIHELAGRCRGAERFSSRSLDIDLLLHGDLVRAAPAPSLPRADILEYGFVLRPLADIAPTLTHPVTGQTIAAHWASFDSGRHPLTLVDVIL